MTKLSDRRWRYDADELMKELERIVAEKAEPEGVRPREAEEHVSRCSDCGQVVSLVHERAANGHRVPFLVASGVG